MSTSTTSVSVSVPSYAGAKLYYTSTSCAAASFIAAYTAGLKGLQLEQVDLKTHLTSKGKDYYSINPKGNVPALVLADGTVLNEGAAVLQFIADQNPEAKLAAPYFTIERYRLQNALNHISSEVQQRIAFAIFGPDSSRETYSAFANKKLAWLEKELTGQFYVGDHFTIADSYLYICLSWTQILKDNVNILNLENYPNVKKYFEGIKALPNVQAAHKLMATDPEKLD